MGRLPVRIVLLALAMTSLGQAFGQSTYLPVSRTLNDRLATRVHGLGSTMHSAIRPWRRGDVDHVLAGDTTMPASQFGILQKWADRKDTLMQGEILFRGGPLIDLQFGQELGDRNASTWTAGGGLWTEVDLGPKWSLQLNGHYWADQLPSFLDTLAEAAHVVPGQGYAHGGDEVWAHYDAGGSINFRPSHFFDISLGRGKNFFGEGYRSLFLSDNANSYPFLRISTNVWKVRYVNLFGMMSDTRGSDGRTADFQKKYASMHYLSWNVSRRLNFAVFEAIIWQSNDKNYERGFDINYLNPVIFYRPVEFGLGSPDNALLGFAVNVKAADHLLFYGQLMFDEFLTAEVRAGNGWFGNKQAFQVGLLAHEAFSIPGLDLRTELNYVRPFMYTHSDTRQNYAHGGEPLAHPFGSNFYEWLNTATWTHERWQVKELFSISEMGLDTGQYSWGNNIFRPERDRPTRDSEGRLQNYDYYLADPVKTTLLINELRVSYLLDPESGLSLEAGHVLRSYSDPVNGDRITNWFRVGIVSYFRERDHTQQVRYALP